MCGSEHIPPPGGLQEDTPKQQEDRRAERSTGEVVTRTGLSRAEPSVVDIIWDQKEIGAAKAPRC